MKPLVVASTRPEIIKLSPVMREFERRKIDYTFVTTGQHYDRSLYGIFIRDLQLKTPDFDIKVGSGTQAYQTSYAMVELEKIMEKQKPDIVIVEGDTNSVLSAALAAVKLHIPVAHVEAGLRSYDRTMPEEINRTLADHCSEVLFPPTEKAALNLVNEGISPEKIHIVGNTIVDAVLQNLEIAEKSTTAVKGAEGEYLVLTLHRAENVDNPQRLKGLVEAIEKIDIPVIFPIHPRTKERLKKFGLEMKNVRLIPPLGYLEFLRLLSRAKAVLTDSGGIQEEAITLHVPCITLRTTTERPETVEAGGNILAGVNPEKILEKVGKVLSDEELYARMKKAENPLGDGTAGKKIVNILLELETKGELKVATQDFTEGFWKKKLIKVDDSLAGKRVKDVDFAILRIFEDGVEKFPSRDSILKIGQMLEIRY
jgi:UDP-N-acetylglucosamine 2-epimerase (non-hydrolysing)